MLHEHQATTERNVGFSLFEQHRLVVIGIDAKAHELARTTIGGIADDYEQAVFFDTPHYLPSYGTSGIRLNPDTTTPMQDMDKALNPHIPNTLLKNNPLEANLINNRARIIALHHFGFFFDNQPPHGIKLEQPVAPKDIVFTEDGTVLLPEKGHLWKEVSHKNTTHYIAESLRYDGLYLVRGIHKRRETEKLHPFFSHAGYHAATENLVFSPKQQDLLLYLREKK